MVRARYRLYVLYYPAQTAAGAAAADQDEWAERLVAELTGGCLMPSTVTVRLDGGHQRDAAKLNVAMMTSYLDHLVDFYLVVFAGTPPSHTRYMSPRSHSAIADIRLRPTCSVLSPGELI